MDLHAASPLQKIPEKWQYWQYKHWRNRWHGKTEIRTARNECFTAIKFYHCFRWCSKSMTQTRWRWCEWSRSGASVPKQVVVDYSLTLLNAASLAFNSTDIKKYIENVVVFDQHSSIRLKSFRCLIRIDIENLIKLVMRWKCFQYDPIENNFFYLRLFYTWKYRRFREQLLGSP